SFVLTPHSKHSLPPAFFRHVRNCSLICRAGISRFFPASFASSQRSVSSLNSRTPTSHLPFRITTPPFLRARPSHLRFASAANEGGATGGAWVVEGAAAGAAAEAAR